VVQRLQETVQLKALLYERRLRALQAFFRFCLLKRKQAFVAISWQLEDFVCRVPAAHQNCCQGPLTGAGVLPHRQKSFGLAESVRHFNSKLLTRARASMKAKLLLCTSSAACLIGREDGKLSLESPKQLHCFLESSLEQTRKFRANFEREKTTRSWTPLPQASYELTEEDTNHSRGLILLKSALLVHSRHSRHCSDRQARLAAGHRSAESSRASSPGPPAPLAAGTPGRPSASLRRG